MRRRIFIAINLPESAKKRLLVWQKEKSLLFERAGAADLARWTKEHNLHLTLIFIGYVADQQMVDICQAAKEIARKYQPFYIDFEKIVYGPPNKRPRLIWLEGQPNQEMTRLKNELENAFLSLKSLNSFRPQNRPFLPHITLARLRAFGQASRLPDIQCDFKMTAPVNSLEVMESELKRAGAEYTVLEKCLLGE